jgi:hypothetical protein
LNRRFQFEKRGQLFIRSHNEPLAVAAMRVSNPKRFRFLNAESFGTILAVQPLGRAGNRLQDAV